MRDLFGTGLRSYLAIVGLYLYSSPAVRFLTLFRLSCSSGTLVGWGSVAPLGGMTGRRARQGEVVNFRSPRLHNFDGRRLVLVGETAQPAPGTRGGVAAYDDAIPTGRHTPLDFIYPSFDFAI